MTTNISSAQLASLSLPKTAAPVAAAGGDGDIDGAGGGAAKVASPQASSASSPAAILSLSPAAKAIVGGTGGA